MHVASFQSVMGPLVSFHFLLFIIISTVVQCLHEPLEIQNGYPVLLTVEGEQRVEEEERLGYGTRVGFRCQEHYRLMKQECNSSCNQKETGQTDSGCEGK